MSKKVGDFKAHTYYVTKVDSFGNPLASSVEITCSSRPEMQKVVKDIIKKDCKEYKPFYHMDRKKGKGFVGVFYFMDDRMDKKTGEFLYDFYYLVEDVEAVIMNDGDLIGEIA